MLLTASYFVVAVVGLSIWMLNVILKSLTLVVYSDDRHQSNFVSRALENLRVLDTHAESHFCGVNRQRNSKVPNMSHTTTQTSSSSSNFVRGLCSRIRWVHSRSQTNFLVAKQLENCARCSVVLYLVYHGAVAIIQLGFMTRELSRYIQCLCAVHVYIYYRRIEEEQK